MAKKSRSTQAVSIFYESSWVLPRGCPCHSHLKDRKHTLHTCSTTRKGHRLPSPAGHWLTGSLWSHWESVTGRHDTILSFFFCCFFFKVSVQLSVCKWISFLTAAPSWRQNVMTNELQSDYFRMMLLRLDVGLQSDLLRAPLLSCMQSPPTWPPQNPPSATSARKMHLVLPY